jgi:hypothetical protein
VVGAGRGVEDDAWRSGIAAPQDHAAVDPLSAPRILTMNLTLAERFARDRGAPQEVDGVVVHNIYRHKIGNGDRIRIRRLRAVSAPPQGLRLKVDRGTLLINEQELKEPVLWAETAPEGVEAICKMSGATGELRIWNCWQNTAGITQAWVGGVLLKCSAGSHPFSPTDLEMQVQFG